MEQSKAHILITQVKLHFLTITCHRKHLLLKVKIYFQIKICKFENPLFWKNLKHYLKHIKFIFRSKFVNLKRLFDSNPLSLEKSEISLKTHKHYFKHINKLTVLLKMHFHINNVRLLFSFSIINYNRIRDNTSSHNVQKFTTSNCLHCFFGLQFIS